MSVGGLSGGFFGGPPTVLLKVGLFILIILWIVMIVLGVLSGITLIVIMGAVILVTAVFWMSKRTTDTVERGARVAREIDARINPPFPPYPVPPYPAQPYPPQPYPAPPYPAPPYPAPSYSVQPAADRCPSCGARLVPGDAYCRSCRRPMPPPQEW